MVRASITVFYGLVFHTDEGWTGPVWPPIAHNEVHCAEEAVTAAGELLGAKPPKVAWDPQNPAALATYEEWWADARVKAAGVEFVLVGDYSNNEMTWGLAVAGSVLKTGSWEPLLFACPDRFTVNPGRNDTLHRFCEAVGIDWREPQWVIAASD